MKKNEIIAEFNPKLLKTDLEAIEDFSRLEKRIHKQTENVAKLDRSIIKHSNELKQRINELGIKINAALFGSKKFINESYAFEIPMQDIYFEPNATTLFKDGILTTQSEVFKDNNQINLNITNISSRKNTDFKFISNTLFIEENSYYNYQELELKLPKNLIAGFLYIEFDTYNNISVLNNFGKEIAPKKITNFIKHPVSIKNKSIILRFNNNTKKKIKILDFFVTEENFRLSSEINTKPIAIGRNLTQIGLNTCDNYSSENIDISYQISINEKEFTEIRPLNKQKNLNINSIITTDPDLKVYKLTNSILNENKKLFLIEEFESTSFNLIDSFEFKLGEELGVVDTTKDIYINIKKDRDLLIAKNTYININGKRIEGGSEGVTYKLKKGLIRLKTTLEFWNQRHNVLETKILEVEGSQVKIRDKFGNINTVIIEKSLFYQLYQEDIYSNKLDTSINFINNRILLSKESENQAYVFIKEKTNFVNTIRLKILLKTNNKNIPPYISSLTLRGI